MIFTPTQDFFSEVLASHYIAGLHYTVQSGNDRLVTAARQWLAEGKIILMPHDRPSDLSPAILSGRGKVR